VESRGSKYMADRNWIRVGFNRVDEPPLDELQSFVRALCTAVSKRGDACGRRMSGPAKFSDHCLVALPRDGINAIEY
jgi:hypothetical protein